MLDLALWLWMALVPGAWLAFVWPWALSLADRWALSAALSPAVVAAGFLAFSALGSPPVTAAWAVFALSLPAAVWIVRAHAGGPGGPGAATAWPVACWLGVPILWIGVHWLALPELRTYGWHNLMHLDIVYELARRPLSPEEPELAGLPLAYPWRMHASWAAVGLLTDRAPIAFHPLQNAILIGATTTLVQRSARVLGQTASASVLAALLAVLGGHWLADLARLSGTTPPELRNVYGDPRLSAVAVKFLYLDAMPVSFALSAAWLRLVLAVRTDPDRWIQVGLGGVLLAGALLYPVMLAAAVGTIASLALCEWWFGAREAAWRLLGQTLVALAALGIGAWALPSAGGGDASGAGFGFVEAAQSLPRLAHVALALAPMVLLAVPGLLASGRARDPVIPGLWIAALGCALAFAILSARSLEYKFVLYARLPLALVIGASLASLRGSERVRVVAAAAVGLVLVGTSLGAGLVRPPPEALTGAASVVTGRFALALAPGESDEGWTRALREETPSDALLVARGLDFHAGAFAARSLYAPVESNGRQSPGYALPNVENLVQFRGHSRREVGRRLAAVEALWAARDSDQIAAALTPLRASGRPLALLLPAPRGDAGVRRSRIDRIAEIAGGRAVYRDARYVLWLLDAPSAGAPSAGAPSEGGPAT